MASVSSLDQDMRQLRMDRYTPQAANEVRSWIEDTLSEPLASGDLLDSLKDGVALCKLANLILPSPGIKYKVSAMPFVQRENISHFLTACERQPLNLPAHDRFLTVDLYDNKDPTQVMQCLGAFSRAANAVNPSRFPKVIGPKKSMVASPTRRPANGGVLGGGYTRNGGSGNANQGSETSPGAQSSTTGALSPTATGGSNSSRATALSPGRSGSHVSSWSKKSDESTTAPAWNIHQYGYMGGASQGNQGVTFGARRQIISPDINVPSLAEKEKRRKEQEAENERKRMEAVEDDRRRTTERDTEQERQQISDEEAQQEEARRIREKEREDLEQERRKWEEEERRWKEEEEQRKLEEEQEAQRILQPSRPAMQDKSRRTTETERIKELERQLEEAKERERQYQAERAGRSERAQGQDSKPQIEVVDVASTEPVQEVEEEPEAQGELAAMNQESEEQPEAQDEREAVNQEDEEQPEAQGGREAMAHEAQGGREAMTQEDEEQPEAQNEQETLNQESKEHQGEIISPPEPSSTRKTQIEAGPPLAPSRPIRPTVPPSLSQRGSKPTRPAVPPSLSQRGIQPPPASIKAGPPSPLPRPLPDPTPYFSTATGSNRTDRFLATNRPPVGPKPNSYFPSEIGMTSTSEGAAEDARRVESQAKTKAGGWASKSLLEREMEKERERQKEWEEAQMERTRGSARSGGPMGPRELKK